MRMKTRKEKKTIPITTEIRPQQSPHPRLDSTLVLDLGLSTILKEANKNRTQPTPLHPLEQDHNFWCPQQPNAIQKTKKTEGGIGTKSLPILHWRGGGTCSYMQKKGVEGYHPQTHFPPPHTQTQQSSHSTQHGQTG